MVPRRDAAGLTGKTWNDAFTLGVLINPRGPVGLVALNIGYDPGILPPRGFTLRKAFGVPYAGGHHAKSRVHSG